jgi:hypothetical protein
VSPYLIILVLTSLNILVFRSHHHLQKSFQSLGHSHT